MIRTAFLSMLSLLFSACVYYVQPDEAATTTAPREPTLIQPAAPPVGNYTYQCQGGRLVVEYLSNRTARVFYGGRYITLTTIPSASGVIYAGGQYRWYSQGRQGYLTQNGRVVMSDCSI